MYRTVVLAVFAVVPLLSACEAEPPNGTAVAVPNIGGTWTAVRVDELAAIPMDEPRLQFTHDGTRVQGEAGCSGFEGSIALVGSSMRVGQLQRTDTRLQCPRAVREYEEAFATAFRSADQIVEVGRGRLRLSGPGGEILLIREGNFELTDAEAQTLERLRNSHWIVVEGTGLPAAPPLPPLDFGDEDFVARGVCGFSGEFRLRGEDLINLYGGTPADGAECPPGEEELRARLLTVLESVSRYQWLDELEQIRLHGRETEVLLEPAEQ